MTSRFAVLLCYLVAIIFVGCKNNTYSQGERLYLAHCANCHMEDGVGLAKLIPPLANSDYLKLHQEVIPCIIRHGQTGEIVVNGVRYNQEMPGEKYTAIQINNMINYINTSWGNQISIVTITETQKRLENCKD